MYYKYKLHFIASELSTQMQWSFLRFTTADSLFPFYSAL